MVDLVFWKGEMAVKWGILIVKWVIFFGGYDVL